MLQEDQCCEKYFGKYQGCRAMQYIPLTEVSSLANFFYLVWAYGCIINLVFWPCYGFWSSHVSKHKSDQEFSSIWWVGLLFTPIWPVFILAAIHYRR
jgi:hypothetical protein